MRWIVLLALATACYAPSPPRGGACTTSCPTGELCIAGECRLPGDSGDSDGDGVTDADDNCPAGVNADQHDEDGDGIGDLCDPCPHLAAGNDDSDGDGVGDACDPAPDTATQRWRLFDPFVARAAHWTGGSRATFADDHMTLPDNSISVLLGGAFRIVAGGRIVERSMAGEEHQLTIQFSSSPTTGAYYYVEAYNGSLTSGFVKISGFDGTNIFVLTTTPYPPPLPLGPFAWVVDESAASQQIRVSATIGGVGYPMLEVTMPPGRPPIIDGDRVRLGAFKATAEFDYFGLIETVD